MKTTMKVLSLGMIMIFILAGCNKELKIEVREKVDHVIKEGHRTTTGPFDTKLTLFDDDRTVVDITVTAGITSQHDDMTMIAWKSEGWVDLPNCRDYHGIGIQSIPNTDKAMLYLVVNLQNEGPQANDHHFSQEIGEIELGQKAHCEWWVEEDATGMKVVCGQMDSGTITRFTMNGYLNLPGGKTRKPERCTDAPEDFCVTVEYY